MLHDRNIVITIGNNRKSVSWQPLSIALSEFYEKLRVPSRSTEVAPCAGAGIETQLSSPPMPSGSVAPCAGAGIET